MTPSPIPIFRSIYPQRLSIAVFSWSRYTAYGFCTRVESMRTAGFSLVKLQTIEPAIHIYSILSYWPYKICDLFKKVDFSWSKMSYLWILKGYLLFLCLNILEIKLSGAGKNRFITFPVNLKSFQTLGESQVEKMPEVFSIVLV